MDRNLRHQQQMMPSQGVPKRQSPMTQRGGGAGEREANAQHDELIKYIQEAWYKVSEQGGTGNAIYYTESLEHRLPGFKPFDLEGWWGRRQVQNFHISRGHQ